MPITDLTDKSLLRQVAQPRIMQLSVAVAIAFLLLVHRLYELQVLVGADYVKRLRTQSTQAYRISPARGSIVDRNGVALAENRGSLDVELYLDELKRHYSSTHRGKMPRLYLKDDKGRPKLDKHGVPVWEVDIVKIVQTSLEPVRAALGIETELDPKDIREHYRIRSNLPYSFRADLDYSTLAQFSERNLGIPGIVVGVRPMRTYTFGALAPHLVGYVGKPLEKDQVGDDNYEFDSVGHSGVEQIMDRQLQGKPGGRIVRVNNRGEVINEESLRPATVGHTLYLTIDARIQHIIETVFRENDVGRAAAVVMDPRNGDILSMVSVPSFDPNEFVPRIPAKRWKQLNNDETNPLINRAVSNYAPGSTWKVLVSLAALKSQDITANTVYNCPASITIGNHVFGQGNLIPTGNFVLRQALQYSANTYFYQAGIKTGPDNITALAQLAGFGESTGLGIYGERSGLVPNYRDPAFMKRYMPREIWTTAHTANYSIGQGFVEVTPLQMARFMCAVANGGTVYYPRLFNGVADQHGDVIANIPVRVRGDLGVTPAMIAAVKDGLLAVVENGTGKKVGGIPGLKVGGKTGSAQFYRFVNGVKMKDTRAWFYGFAPFDKPRYAFCFFVEGGDSGGGTAGPLVHQFLERLMALERGETSDLSYLAPAIGHFHGLQVYQPKEPAGGADQPAVVPEDSDTQAATEPTPTPTPRRSGWF